ncbi:arginine--tRNA ligase [Candidatus Azoamicus ciliaticola]|uniref:Arginine--tRNA ligase n=1 Tax=Candidatus Azoamicus ciliaticola TaxID=2652803 RepID=A0A6J5JY17_9GAMM|nr:arginine--tRNA ligase [Candidatus Azoamicus ciliaticola]CAB3976481.1 Arginine--tRNA ligase [Candidatus Azoamicus ciliaticola]
MIKTIKTICYRAIIKKFPILHKQLKLKDIDVSQSKDTAKYHFQFNGVMKLSQYTKEHPLNIAKKIQESIEQIISNEFLTSEITHPGFINFKINQKLIKKKLNKLFKKIKIKNKEKIIIDYSSPNIAKDMHVGHLRSTIIGDCLAKILKYTGNTVIKISHLGDWGTQFGILINYIKNKYNTQTIKKLPLQKLSELYKDAQKKFETDNSFKEHAKKEVIKLQNKEKNTINIWKEINKISKKEYKKIYDLLNIKIKYKGESFYNDLINPLIKKFEKKNIIEISNNAKCIYIDGMINKENLPLPLIIKKSDGGSNYATTDLAALYYRIKYNKANKIIYITDVGQSMHFKMVFEAIKKSEINKNTHLIHLPIGLMLTSDGKKIKTRSGESEKLISLLKKAINYSKKILKSKNNKINKTMLNNSAKILGINTIKYSDLSNKIDQNYIFDYKKILQSNGNTASFLNYAYVRINSIRNKIRDNKKIDETILNLQEKTEIDLAVHLTQYNYIIEKTEDELNPNILTTYLYKLAEKFHSFFHECNVIKSQNKNSRLLLCKITSKILKSGMSLLGLKIIKRM